MENDYNLLDVSGRIIAHNKEEIEIKLEYNLKELEKKSNFKVECYFFIPSSLNINNETYSIEDFYQDAQHYLRFKTPKLRLQDILDPDFVKSPLFRLEVIKNELLKEFSRSKVKSAIRELKLLGCMTRARFRDYYSITYKLLSEGKQVNLSENLLRVSDKSFEILKKLRHLKEEYTSNFPSLKQLIRYFQVTDEFLSNLIEFEMVKILCDFKNNFSSEVISPEVSEKIERLLLEEKEFRNKNGFSLHFRSSLKDKERYLFFMGQYKKALASALYLDIKRKKHQDRQIHVIGSIAAFAASAFSYISIVWIMQKYAFNTNVFTTDSALFIFLASISYVFKDRIKEFIKLIFNPKMLSKYPDYDTTIFIQPEHPVKIGNIREKVRFVDRSTIDSTVLSMREETIKNDHLFEEMREDILLYQKELNFDVDTINKLNTRTVDITDIMRYCVKKYTPRMNEPDEEIYFYDDEEKKPSWTMGGRCYFLNLVIKYTSHPQNSERLHYERYRIIVRKSGIEEIEMVKQI